MWRSNITWGSIDLSPPEGMHKHETGAYFKTSSQPPPPPPTDIEAQQQQPSQPQDNQDKQADRQLKQTDESSSERQREESAKRARTRSQQDTTDRNRKGRQRRLSGAIRFGQKQQEAPPSSGANFRSRLSSISGALQKPRRLLSIGSSASHAQATPNAAVQITTTSESPEHCAHHSKDDEDEGKDGGGGDDDDSDEDRGRSSPSQFDFEQQQRFLSSSSGRRLSQLFLPQVPPSAANLLAAGQDPYASGVVGELIPPHLLGLYGQTQASPVGGHRASWADASLFARLNHARPSLDSGAQRRHSLDSRKYCSI